MLTVYTKNNCPFCDRAKALLESRGVEYRAINLEDQPDARDFLVNQGLRSVPQVFNSETLLPGGYQGLVGQPEKFWTNLKG